MKRLMAVATVALACAAPAIAAKPPKKGQPNASLTIKASATRVTYGHSVTISGTTKGMTAGTAIDVEANPYPYTGGFKPTGKTGVVQPDGTYSVGGLVPLAHTQYKVVAKTSPPSESTSVFVRVRLRVSLRVSDHTPRRGQRVRFYGRVAPAHDGKPLLIQRRTRTGYRTIARTTLRDKGTATSKWSKRLRIRRKGTYRVIAESLDQDHDNGISRRVTLRVH